MTNASPVQPSSDSKSVWSRIYSQVGDTLSDAYGHYWYGDEAGECHSRIVFVIHPSKHNDKDVYNYRDNNNDPTFDLGMQFVSVNSRAHVFDVDPESEAFKCGIRSRDVLQFAMILKDTVMENISENQVSDHCLELEQNKGLRTSYCQLKAIFDGYCSCPSNDIFLDNIMEGGNDKFSRNNLKMMCQSAQNLINCSGRTIMPTNINHHESPLKNVGESKDSTKLGNSLFPVALVFRRTCKRNLTNHSNISLSFRLDEEFDRATHIVQRLISDAENDNDEALKIRSMIQNAVGLAFIRSTKLGVLGVMGVHGGSGIIISRLPDGTWSAPSAVGTYGVGLGLQFGLEVVDYIYIIQTHEAMSQISLGKSLTVERNIGASLATLTNGGEKAVEDNVGRATPIVAYAQTQSLYFEISLKGSTIYARNDINSKTYKFTNTNIDTRFIGDKNISSNTENIAHDILNGNVSSPPESEELYTYIYSLELAQKISTVPNPPDILRDGKEWRSGRSIFSINPSVAKTRSSHELNSFSSFLSNLSPEESQHFSDFEIKFKNFLGNGVSILHFSSSSSNSQRRTLCLKTPEQGSLQLGFLTNKKIRLTNRNRNMNEEQSNNNVTPSLEAKTMIGTDGTIQAARFRDIELSQIYTIALTDVTLLSQRSDVNMTKLNINKTSASNMDGKNNNASDRMICVSDMSGKTLNFLVDNSQAAEYLVCGLKLLIEVETARLGIRGGISKTQAGGNSVIGREIEISTSNINSAILKNDTFHRQEEDSSKVSSSSTSTMSSNASSKYADGKVFLTEIAKGAPIPVPLSTCRVLILDSSSPVIRRWELDRGDKNVNRSQWHFSPGSKRGLDMKQLNDESEVITTGPMIGASRTKSFDKKRSGTIIHLKETYTVDADDKEQFVCSITEEMIRNGFSVKIRLLLCATGANCCQAIVLAELGLVEENLPDQSAIHKAYKLTVSELKSRYGIKERGLVSELLSVINDFSHFSKITRNENVKSSSSNTNKSSKKVSNIGNSSLKQQVRAKSSKEPPLSVTREDKKSTTMLLSPKRRQVLTNIIRKSSEVSLFGKKYKSKKNNQDSPPSSRFAKEDQNSNLEAAMVEEPENDLENEWNNHTIQSRKAAPLTKKSVERPGTPSFGPTMMATPTIPQSQKVVVPPKKNKLEHHPTKSSSRVSVNQQQQPPKKRIEVKPLPKIRLELMPCPREEDEDNYSSSSPAPKEDKRRKRSKPKTTKTTVKKGYRSK